MFTTILISFFSVVLGISTPLFAEEPATIYTGSYPNGLVITTNNAVVTDAEIQNPSGNGLVIRADNVIIDEVIIHNVRGHGIIIESSHDVTLRHSIIYDTAKGTCYPSCTGGWASAVKIRSANETTDLSYNILIQNNVIYENYGEGIGARGSLITIRNNTLYDNFSVNIYSNSDNMWIEKNYVYCTANTKFYRNNFPATGIAVSQELFPNWSGHAYRNTVVNNVVNGCGNGFAFNGSEAGVAPTGFRDSIIAFNTFVNLKRAAIRIDYEQGQNNLIVHNNIGTMSSTANFSEISYEGNLTQSSVTFIQNSSNETSFILSTPKAATGFYRTEQDFGGTTRSSIPTVGAWE